MKAFFVNYDCKETFGHEELIIMVVAFIQIQTQYQYRIAFATRTGRSLLGRIEQLETFKFSNNPIRISIEIKL